MKEAKYIEITVTTRNTVLDIVNYYCPNDKKLLLDTIQVHDSGYSSQETLTASPRAGDTTQLTGEEKV